MHADKASALEAKYDAFHFEACPPEVDQQAQVQTGRLQIIQALRSMNLIDSMDYFQFNEDGFSRWSWPEFGRRAARFKATW